MNTKLKTLSALIMALACSTAALPTQAADPQITIPVTSVSLGGTTLPTSWKDFATPVVFKADLDALLDTKAGDLVALALPEGGMVFTTVSMTVQDGDAVWIGQVQQTGSTTQAQVHFSAKGEVFGQIQTLIETYDIDSVGDATYLLAMNLSGIPHPVVDHDDGQDSADPKTLLDQALATPAPVSAAETLAQAQENVLASPEDASMATIDVMALYTNDLPRAEVDKYLHKQIVYGNQAFKNSGIHMRLRLVHTEAFQASPARDYQFMDNLLTGATDAGLWVPWLAGGREAYVAAKGSEQGAKSWEGVHSVPPEFAKLDQMRQQYGADEVLIVVKDTLGPCGKANVVGTFQWQGMPSDPFKADHSGTVFSRFPMVAVVNTDGSCGTAMEVVAHEIGHNLGSGHIAGNTDTVPRFAYAYGWRGDFWTTVMKSTIGKDILPYFSNPNVTQCNGSPCGVAEVADDARAFNEVRHIVAALLPATVPDDGTDGTLQDPISPPGLCSGLASEADLTGNLDSKPAAKAMIKRLKVAVLKCNNRITKFKKTELKKIRLETKGNPAQFQVRKAEMLTTINDAKVNFIRPIKARIGVVKAFAAR
jgi:hypothetical protein